MWPITAKVIYEIVTGQQNAPKILQDDLIYGICTDSRRLSPNQLFVAIKGDYYDGHSFLKSCFNHGLVCALVSKDSEHFNELNPDKKERCIVVEDITIAFRRLAKHFRQRFSFPVIGVGGSNGKTTTKELIASLLSAGQYKITKTDKSENGFLGIPITLLQEDHIAQKPPKALVLEIGIDDKGAMQQHVDISEPDIVVLTALGPEHLSGLGSWADARSEEMVLFSSSKAKKIWQLSDEFIRQEFLARVQTSTDPFLVNDIIVAQENVWNDVSEFLHEIKNLIIPRLVLWRLKEGSPFHSVIEIGNLSGLFLPFSIPLPGIHNAQNFALAFAVSKILGLSDLDIEKGFQTFSPPERRSQISVLSNNVTLYDDSYNASPLSIKTALESLNNAQWKEKNKIIILGDMLDLGGESNYWHEKIVTNLTPIQNADLCLYGKSMYDCYQLIKREHSDIEKSNNLRIFWLDRSIDPADFFSMIKSPLRDCIVLVKGSNGMKLDRVVRHLKQECQQHKLFTTGECTDET